MRPRNSLGATEVAGFSSYLDSLSRSTTDRTQNSDPPTTTSNANGNYLASLEGPSEKAAATLTDTPDGHYATDNFGAEGAGYEHPHYGGYSHHRGPDGDAAADARVSEAGKQADDGGDLRWGAPVSLDSVPAPRTTGGTINDAATISPVLPQDTRSLSSRNDEEATTVAAAATRALFLENGNARTQFTTQTTPQPVVQFGEPSTREEASAIEESFGVEKAGASADDEAPATETQKLMRQVKDAGAAGVVSYALWELGFWALSVPVCAVGYFQVTGHWPDPSDPEDQKKLGAEAFAFVNVARFAVPLRIGLALGTTPWIEKNVVQRLGRKKKGDEEGRM